MNYLFQSLQYLLVTIGSLLFAAGVICSDLTSVITGALYIIAGYLFLAAKRSKK